jgi:hypothetical protein
MEITTFWSATCTKPVSWSGSWAGFCSYLWEASRIPWERSHKLDYLALIPGKADGRRISDVRQLSAICGDIDLPPNDPRYTTFGEACAALRRAGLKFAAYTTTKHTAAHNRYRVILP